MNDMEIPTEIREKVIRILHSHEKYQYYEKRLLEYQRTHNLAGIKKMQGILDNLESKVLSALLKEQEEETTTLYELMKDMSEEDRELLQIRLHAIVFMCDMIDDLVNDIESTMNKYFPDAHVTFYDRLRSLGTEVKMHVDTCMRTSTERNKLVFCKYASKVMDAALPYIRTFVNTQKRIKAKVEETQSKGKTVSTASRNIVS